MPVQNSEPSETSPLLPKPDHIRDSSRHPIDASGGLVPEGADPYKDDEETENEDGDVEGQEIHMNQHEGLPEVKKQMKYLMPALGIGVGTSLLMHTTSANPNTGLSCCC